MAIPGADAEVFWDETWIRRIGSNYFPDPEFFSNPDRAWSRWAAKADKFVSDANDYWFHVYRPTRGDRIVDIGAGRGEDVFAFSRAVGPEGHVWAFEPHPVSFLSLEKLCQWNGLTNVTPLNVACSNVASNLQIETLPVWESNYVRPGEASATSHPVVAIPFDAIFEEREIGHIDFLKMNIEGAERTALPGCRRALEASRFVCIAAHDFRAARGEDSRFRTLDFVRESLTASGFKLITRDNDPRYYVPFHVHGFRD